MLNTNKMISQKNKLRFDLSEDKIKNVMEDFEFTDDLDKIERNYPVIAALMCGSENNKEKFSNIVEDINNITTFKMFLDCEINNLMKNKKFDRVAIKQVIKEQLYPYYKGRYLINMSRELSFLPLNLRLFVYNELLQLENNKNTCMNYLDRIAITLCKMEIKNNKNIRLANSVCSYNWILQWGNFKGGTTDQVFIDDIAFLNEGLKLRKKIFNKKDRDIKSELDEFSVCLSGLSDLNNVYDRDAAKIVIDIINVHFKNIPDIDKITSDLKEYMNTGNKQTVSYIKNLINSGKKNKFTSGANNEHIIKSNKVAKTLPIDEKDLENLSFKEVLSLAEQNYHEAQFEVGYRYALGTGVKQSYTKAKEWYMEAIKQNNHKAQCNLGDLYRGGLGVGINYKKALELFKLSAKQGNADAYCNLGMMYDTGLGVPINKTLAREYYIEAANRGQIHAQFNLGMKYFLGLDGQINHNEARKWFEKAASQGDIDAQMYLGMLR